jgi:hypothetical protein
MEFHNILMTLNMAPEMQPTLRLTLTQNHFIAQACQQHKPSELQPN